MTDGFGFSLIRNATLRDLGITKGDGARNASDTEMHTRSKSDEMALRMIVINMAAMAEER